MKPSVLAEHRSQSRKFFSAQLGALWWWYDPAWCLPPDIGTSLLFLLWRCVPYSLFVFFLLLISSKIPIWPDHCVSCLLFSGWMAFFCFFFEQSHCMSCQYYPGSLGDVKVRTFFSVSLWKLCSEASFVLKVLVLSCLDRWL